MKKLPFAYALLCVLPAAVAGQVPGTISHQGFLTDNSGIPLTGTYDITFTFYESGTDNVVHSDAIVDVQVTDGVYEVDIGVSGVPFDQVYDLGITVSPDEEMPRRVLTSSPYALGLRNLRIIPHTDSDGPNMIGGWTGNTVTNSVGATIGGGGNPMGPSGSPGPNQIEGNYATISGGARNNAMGLGTVIGGGLGNLAGATAAVVCGGRDNTAGNLYSTVGGGRGNLADGLKSTIGGGGRFDDNDDTTGNEVQEDFGTIGGGTNNKVGNDTDNRQDAMYGTVGGGNNNQARAESATVGGGDSNAAHGVYATVGGGNFNAAHSTGSTVGGGDDNDAYGVNATVAGGGENAAFGESSMVPGGQGNRADGVASFAAGRMATAAHDGAFVWQDNSPTGTAAADSLISTAENQFRARASGGFYLHTGAPSTTSGVKLRAGESSWDVLSSVDAKTDFEPVNVTEVLDRLAEIDILRWRYKEGTTPHIGPTAHDFHTAFGVGPDAEHISTVDADGVALAAIQGLYTRVVELAAEVQELRKQIAELR